MKKDDVEIEKTDEEWRQELTDEQYRVLREKGTETPFSGQLLNNEETGMYVCAACGQNLFPSDAKFESDIPGLIGWPAFAAEAEKGNIRLEFDESFGMRRTEILCSRCGSHLGHLFENDPASKTGLHYCVNSVALDFRKSDTPGGK